MSPQFLPITETFRRFLALVPALLLAASLLAVATAAPALAAVEKAIDGITYTVQPGHDAEAAVTGYDASFGTVVVIPPTVTIDGAEYTVTEIGYAAFSQKGLTSVTLPDGLVGIGSSAFFGNALTSVTIPDSVVDVGVFAFYEGQLTSVTLANSLVTIGEGAFAINRLVSVVVPPSVTTVGLGAFHTNPEMSRVQFTGPAPTTITAAGVSFPSLGNAAGLTVFFPSEYLAQSSQPGYTTPEWFGYEAHPVYTVTFDARGGEAIEPVIVSRSEPVDVPAVPVREGFTFTGWYTTPELETAFEFQLPATENLTLYAGWQTNTVPVEPVTTDLGSLITGSLGLLGLAGSDQ